MILFFLNLRILTFQSAKGICALNSVMWLSLGSLYLLLIDVLPKANLVNQWSDPRTTASLQGRTYAWAMSCLLKADLVGPPRLVSLPPPICPETTWSWGRQRVAIISGEGLMTCPPLCTGMLVSSPSCGSLLRAIIAFLISWWLYPKDRVPQ